MMVPPPSTSILVLGAGELGTAVLKALVSRRPGSVDVSVLLRPSTITAAEGPKAEQVATLLSLPVLLLAGDLHASSVAELAKLFRPYDVIIGCTGFALSGGLQLKIAQAVLAAGVARYVPWQFGVDYDLIGRGSGQDLFDEQLDVREVLRGQATTEWIIITTGIFTSFLFESSFELVQMAGGSTERMPIVRALGGWDREVTVTTPEDIGNLTAQIIFEEPQIKNSIVYTASDTITYRRLADVVEEVTGQQVDRELWDVDFLKGELEKDPDNVLKKYRLVFADGGGVAWDLPRTFNVQKGIPVTDVKSWAFSNLVDR